jgi:predicted nucleic acid-binding protein
VPTKVVDASAIAAALFVEPGGTAILQRVRGSELASPNLLPFELANVCWKKIKRHPESSSELIESLRNYPRLGVAEHIVPMEEVVDLAMRLGVTAYDAAYAWVARALGAELVTLDKQLEKAHRRLAAE